MLERPATIGISIYSSYSSPLPPFFPPQGATETITSDYLQATDESGSSSGELVFTVTEEIDGQVVVDGVPSDTFTQQDILDNVVSFVHDGSDSDHAGFAFEVSNGDSTTPPQVFMADIIQGNSNPSLINNGLTVNQASAALLPLPPSLLESSLALSALK
jgi:hypothetical protein